MGNSTSNLNVHMKPLKGRKHECFIITTLKISQINTNITVQVNHTIQDVIIIQTVHNPTLRNIYPFPLRKRLTDLTLQLHAWLVVFWMSCGWQCSKLVLHCFHLHKVKIDNFHWEGWCCFEWIVGGKCTIRKQARENGHSNKGAPSILKRTCVLLRSPGDTSPESCTEEHCLTVHACMGRSEQSGLFILIFCAVICQSF